MTIKEIEEALWGIEAELWQQEDRTYYPQLLVTLENMVGVMRYEFGIQPPEQLRYNGHVKGGAFDF